MGQDLSIEIWDVYHWLKSIITTKPHINVPDNELKDLQTWVKMNFPNLDPMSVVAHEFWDIANWKLYNSVALSRDQSVANLLPVCCLMLNIFQQLNPPAVSLAPQIDSLVPLASQIGHAALSLPQHSSSSLPTSQASPPFPLSGCSRPSHFPHARGLYCLNLLHLQVPCLLLLLLFRDRGKGPQHKCRLLFLIRDSLSSQHKCQAAPNLGDSL